MYHALGHIFAQLEIKKGEIVRHAALLASISVIVPLALVVGDRCHNIL